MEHVLNELLGLVDSLDVGSSLFGKLDDKSLCMPKESKDGRHLTWAKLCKSLSEKVQNEPLHKNDCWFVKSNNNHYHQTKISISGGNNKWLTHRLTYALLYPKDIDKLMNFDDDSNVAHKCGRGRSKKEGGLVCINPYHVMLTTKKINESQKYCKHGTRYLCPHEEKCIYTWEDTGKAKECFNRKKYHKCKCERTCKHEL
jgi:hypothetical protein